MEKVLNTYCTLSEAAISYNIILTNIHINIKSVAGFEKKNTSIVVGYIEGTSGHIGCNIKQISREYGDSYIEGNTSNIIL